MRGNLQLAPLERGWIVVGRLDVLLDGSDDVCDMRPACTAEDPSIEDAKPAFNKAEPARVGRSEVKMNVGMSSQPQVLLRLVSA